MVEAADPVVLDPSVAGHRHVQHRRRPQRSIQHLGRHFVVAGAGAVRLQAPGNLVAVQLRRRLRSPRCAIDLDPDAVARAVTEIGMGFCFRPRFHAALRPPARPARELGVRTAFNFLGPMAQPRRSAARSSASRTPGQAHIPRVLVANGAERPSWSAATTGSTSSSTTTTSTPMEWVDGESAPHEVDATAFGLARAEPADPLGGDATVNAEAARRCWPASPAPRHRRAQRRRRPAGGRAMGRPRRRGRGRAGVHRRRAPAGVLESCTFT